MRIRRADIRRFWSKVAVRSENDCWIWQAGKLPGGRGSFWLDGRDRPAQRVMHWLAFGPFNTALTVNQSCGEPSCVNPRHLLLGKSGRKLGAAFRKSPEVKLDEFQVATIRMLYAGERPPTQEKLAQAFGVSNQQISRIVRGLKWKDAPGPIVKGSNR